MAMPAIDGYALLEHGVHDVVDLNGPDQRMTRLLEEADVAFIRRETAAEIPIYRTWRQHYEGAVSYHTARRAARHIHYWDNAARAKAQRRPGALRPHLP